MTVVQLRKLLEGCAPNADVVFQYYEGEGVVGIKEIQSNAEAGEVILRPDIP